MVRCGKRRTTARPACGGAGVIRFRRLTPVSLNSWLVDQGIPQTHQRYRLRVWREVHGALGALRVELIAYVQEALDDARRRIRSGFQDDLRSEEHTSELQSLMRISYAVFCLKKTK